MSSLSQKRQKLRELTKGYFDKLENRAKGQQFKFMPFSKKQLQVLTWWTENSPVKDKKAIIADGAIRSGKTISMSLSFVFWAMSNFDGVNFAFCGKTIGSLRRNVISDLKRMLRSRGYKVRHRVNEGLLIIQKGERINYFYTFGGKDEGSAELIQGITLGGALFDEVALQTRSFVEQATARCSVKGSRLWFNCNPEGPEHWFKKEWIDNLDEKSAVYLHFMLDDNNSLDEETKRWYKSSYRGVFFKRFILGQWCVADGAIYDMFDEAVHKRDCGEKYYQSYVSVDYGTQNACVFLHFKRKNREHLNYFYVSKELYYDGRDKKKQKTDEEYADDMVEFIMGEKVDFIIVDPSATSFIAALRKRGLIVKPGKNDVLDGIRHVATALSTERLFVSPSCEHTISEFKSYAWDSKAADNGEDKPVKKNDHCMDALRYGVFTFEGGTQVTAYTYKPI